MLEHFGAEASVLDMTIIVRSNPSKAAILEEFLHGTQEKLGIAEKLGRYGLGSAETHVKDFMIRQGVVMNIILPIKDIFIIAGNIVFSVLYNEHLEFPCRCQLLSSNSEVMQELYIEKELFIKRTTENDCRALVLRGTLEYLFDEIIAGECALALLQKEIKKD